MTVKQKVLYMYTQSGSKFFTTSLILVNKGVSFQKNCGAALVGEYKRVIWYYQLS